MSARISGDSSNAATSAEAERDATVAVAKEVQLRGPDPRLFAQRGGRFVGSREGKPYLPVRTENACGYGQTRADSRSR